MRGEFLNIGWAARLWMPLAFLALASLSAQPQANASEDPVFIDYRQVDATGKYYVVVRRLGGPVHDATAGRVEVLIAERRPESPTVKPAEGKAIVVTDFKRPFGYAVIVKSTVGIRDGDRILGRFKLPDAPRVLLIAPKRKRIICVDEHGMNQRVVDGPAVRVYRLSGQLVFGKTLKDIFDNEAEMFATGTYGIDWYRSARIDEKRNELILVAAEEDNFSGVTEGLPDERRVRVINLKTSKVRLGSKKEVARAIKEQCEKLQSAP